jgi:hypothetical protein
MKFISLIVFLLCILPCANAQEVISLYNYTESQLEVVNSSLIQNQQKESMEKNNGKKITIRRVIMNSDTPTTMEIEMALDKAGVEFNNINVANWPGFNYSPTVKFRIAYSNKELYLQYTVKERDLKAVFGVDSASQPYKDSCCEFFVMPQPDKGYYNLELNCIGKGTFAYRCGDEKVRFGSAVLSKIRRDSSLGSEPFGTKPGNEKEMKAWKLTIAIPFELFSMAKISPVSGETIRANFYKCGDDMPQKHYFSWNPILTPKPNFHTPDYFGLLIFE